MRIHQFGKTSKLEKLKLESNLFNNNYIYVVSNATNGGCQCLSGMPDIFARAMLM